jgi:hypothetical protein
MALSAHKPMAQIIIPGYKRPRLHHTNLIGHISTLYCFASLPEKKVGIIPGLVLPLKHTQACQPKRRGDHQPVTYLNQGVKSS